MNPLDEGTAVYDAAFRAEFGPPGDASPEQAEEGKRAAKAATRAFLAWLADQPPDVQAVWGFEPGELE